MRPIEEKRLYADYSNIELEWKLSMNIRLRKAAWRRNSWALAVWLLSRSDELLDEILIRRTGATR